MKIAELNMVPNGSTGKIMLQIAEVAREQGHDVHTYTPVMFQDTKQGSRIPDHYHWGNKFEQMLHHYLGIIFGLNGMLSANGTRALVKQLEAFHPDIIHLHNLHKFCINFPILFDYIKNSGVKVIWTLHDCWTFTGHCPYFTMIKCDKWKTECYECPQLSVYPKSWVDHSTSMYRSKKIWFSGIKDMTLVTPSEWLAGLVKESFLDEYPVKVINNGIDLNIFKPRKSDFRSKYNCENKKIVLGVSFDWGRRKGLDVFIELSRRLPNNYQIILVGTDDNTDKNLPENIVSIHRTQDQVELAEIYSSSDIFVNPTREDNYPTVNMESIACGTPVVTFKTGGSPEMLDCTCGSVVECDDVEAMMREIIRICEDKPYTQEACLTKAGSFDMNLKFKEYVKLYEDCTHST